MENDHLRSMVNSVSLYHRLVIYEMSLWTKEYVLDEIIDEMVNAVETSKDEIFRISEEARNEYTQLEKELKQTKDNVAWHIKESDALERKVQLSKQRLSEVSKHFDRYSEDEIREVYEKTHTMQTQLAMVRQREKAMREKRDHVERRLLSLDRTNEREVRLTDKVSVILKYFNVDFLQSNEMIEEAKEKQEFRLKIIEAQEEERLKLSRDIHDGPALMLADILFGSEFVDRAFLSGDVAGA